MTRAEHSNIKTTLIAKANNIFQTYSHIFKKKINFIEFYVV